LIVCLFEPPLYLDYPIGELLLLLVFVLDGLVLDGLEMLDVYLEALPFHVSEYSAEWFPLVLVEV